MTPIRSCIPESTGNMLRDLYRCGSLRMFLVSLLYERTCSRIDIIKINCSLNVPFIIWFLYVLNSITSEIQCGSYRVFTALASAWFILFYLWYIFSKTLVSTRKIHKNYIRDPNGLFSIISHVSLSRRNFGNFPVLFYRRLLVYIIKRTLHGGLKI